MSTDWRAWFWKSSIAIALALGGVTVPGWESMVSAQIIPDETLGAESSVVTPDRIKGIESDRISGGAVRGSNLFHSFREFNVGEGKGGYFENPAAIENIFSRVTGSNPSEILGTLGVLGNANLFFLNPNGIIFGNNASLDLRGSFVGTTANSFTFPDGKQFSATNPEVLPLLTVNVQQPIGLQFEGQEGIITNAADLAVTSRQTLSLSGSDVATTGNLTAPGGRVEVLGTNSVALLENATIDVSAPTGGGTVLIGGDFQGRGTVPNAQRTYVDDNVTINADALTSGNGGNVIVWADEVTGFYGNISARGGVESGHGGLVEVSGKEHLIFRGNVDTSAVNGLPGTLLLDPANIIIADGSGDEAEDGNNTFAGNNSGVVGSILTAPLSEIEDTAPTTIYESELEGLSGDTNIVLQATNDITLQDLTDNGLELAAGAGVIALSADADRNGVGNFVMEDTADTINTNGRNIGISGASLTLGNIDTSFVLDGQTTIVDVDAGGPIPETGTIGTATFTFTVPDLGEPINNLDVRFSAAHTWDSDLDVFLTSPQGTIFELFSDVGGSDDNFQDTLLDDRAPRSIADGLPPFPESYRPTGTGGLAVFNGETPAGIWTLNVTDDFVEEDSGTLYKNGDIAPWGTAIGTQLLFTSPITGGGDSGGIMLNATNGNISAGNLNASNNSGTGAPILIEANGEIGINGTIDASGVLGNGGDITLSASGNINLNPGSNIFSNGLLGGNIILQSNSDISVTGTSTSGLINSNSFSRVSGAVGGDINVMARSFSLTNGAQLEASPFGRADAGGVIVETTEFVLLDGINSNGVFSAIGSQVLSGIEGNAGDVTIETGRLLVTNSAAIRTDTFGAGDGGDLTITATEVEVTGELIDAINPSGLFATVQPRATGTGGNLTIETGRLLVTNGAVVGTDTFGGGKGGNLEITATEVEVIGESAFDFSPSNLSATVQSGATAGGGNITINTERLLVTNGAEIRTNTSGAGDGGDLTITATEVEVSGESIFSFSPSKLSANVGLFADGQGGDLKIETQRLLVANGAEITTDTLTLGAGDGGDLTIIATDVEVISEPAVDFSFSKLSADVELFSTGQGGDLKIETERLLVTGGSQLQAATFGQGDSGDVTIDASKTILFDGEGSGLFARAQGIGNVGDIEIRTGSLYVRGGAQIQANTSGIGNAGNIRIEAREEVSFEGTGSSGVPSAAFTRVEDGTMGQGGNIEVTTGSLTLVDGAQLTATTFGQGNAGRVIVRARDSISLEGVGVDNSPSALSSQVGLGAVGDSGGIEIETGLLSIVGGAQLTTFTRGQGNAGNIEINAHDTIALDGIASEGFSTQLVSGINSGAFAGAVGNGGDITINAESLSITNGAQISSSTSTKGNAGNIEINARETVFIGGSADIIGISDFDEFPSGVVSGLAIEELFNIDGTLLLESRGAGRAGNITIATRSLSIDDGFIDSAVGSGTVANEPAEITIQANTVSLTNGANVTASTAGKGDAGNIFVQDADSVSLADKSSISTAVNRDAEGQGGNIDIQTDSLSLTDGAVVSARTEGKGEAGNIVITANILEATSGSQLQTNTTTNFDAADITLKISDNLFLSGTDSGLFAQTAGEGKAGNININTPKLTIGKDAEISATTTATSTNTEGGGNITVNASNLDLTGKLGIFAETKGEAPAGTLNIQPDNNKPNLDILFTDTAIISASTTASGTGGNINLTAPETINITGQGKVAVETRGTGDAGSINITSQKFNISNQTEISASTFSSGQAGNINITVNNFNLREGATVITNTAGSGQAGDIQLEISDNLNLFNSKVTASTAKNSTGRGGNINIDPQKVTLTNSQIAVNSQGEGTGGNLTLQADALTLANQSAITAETFSTNGGNIEIAVGGNIILRDNSQISATAGTSQAGGNGGNIIIDAPFIIAFPQDNSDITANAFEGDGGNIKIDTNGIFGIEFRDEETPLSDITASSEFGQQGEVEINTSAVDPTRGLNNLPQEGQDTEVAQSCSETASQSTLEFFDIGRGGLPPTPDDLFSSEIVIAEWIPLDLANDKVQEQTLEGSFTEEEITNLTLLTNLSCRKN